MVEDTVTDGKRIAQLLASELTGLETGPLGAVEVVDAETEVIPDESGPVAYQFECHGTVAGRVRVYPDRADIEFGPDYADEAESGEREVVPVRSGADVKKAVDEVRSTLGGE